MPKDVLSELISPHMMLLMNRLKDAGSDSKVSAALQALERQLFCSVQEEKVLSYELGDPLGSHRYEFVPRMIHQYKNRALVLTTSKCFSHCRYCFRKNYASSENTWLSDMETKRICDYLLCHTEIKEILLSGGDPLTASDEQIFSLIGNLRNACPDLLVRICTRSPIFCPERITSKLVDSLKNLRPLWIVLHVNHPVEISKVYSPESYNSIRRFIDAGISVQSQTVLLKNVNDSVAVLADLFHQLTCLGVKPGYLFQGDLVPGTSHFRVPIQDGLRLYEDLRCELSGLSTPVYAVDLPGGGGKFNLLQLDSSLLSTSVRRTESYYVFTKYDNSIWKYPVK